jgi:hypothetical protein
MIRAQMGVYFGGLFTTKNGICMIQHFQRK